MNKEIVYLPVEITYRDPFDTECLEIKLPNESKMWIEEKNVMRDNSLLKLPVSVGDIVYIVSRNNIIPLEIYQITVNKDSIQMHGRNEEYYGYGSVTLYSNKEIIDWFTTKEEAEQALAEMEGE